MQDEDNQKELFDLIVLGSGPGGYVAAIRAAQRKAKVALIEAKDLGGVCLNCGCIPSKTLISNAEVVRKIKAAENFGVSVKEFSIDYLKMKERKDEVVSKIRKGLEGLVRSNKITIFKGFGKFTSPNEIKILGEDERIIRGKNIIVATGSEPRSLPFVSLDHLLIHDSTSMLNISRIPKKLLIMGGGVIGCEFASLYRELGSEVTLIELLPSLIAAEGKSLSEALSLAFKKRGIQIETQAEVTEVKNRGDAVEVTLKGGKKLEGDTLLVSVGRSFNSSGIGLENTGVIVDKNGSIPTNEKMQTNVSHIYAIGDVTGKYLLAHVASHQGLIAADNATQKSAAINYRAVPSVIYTYPEVASLGLTLEKALEAGFDAIVGKFPFQALGKAQAIKETEGFAQIVLVKTSGQILGAQVMGYDASNLIAEIALAMQNELTVHEIGDTIHAHPTQSEAWMEAAFQAIGMPLHLPPKN